MGEMTCQTCGARMQLGAPFCHTCGSPPGAQGRGQAQSAFPVQYPTATAPSANSQPSLWSGQSRGVLPAMIPSVCPLCGSPDIQKASAVYSAGAWNSQSYCQPTAGAPYDPNTRHVVTTSGGTVLAQRLAPPQMFTNACVCLVVTVVLFAILASGGGIGSCIPFFIGALVVEALCIHYGSQTYKRWSTLWYCRRCDSAFGPPLVSQLGGHIP